MKNKISKESIQRMFEYFNYKQSLKHYVKDPSKPQQVQDELIQKAQARRERILLRNQFNRAQMKNSYYGYMA